MNASTYADLCTTISTRMTGIKAQHDAELSDVSPAPAAVGAPRSVPLPENIQTSYTTRFVGADLQKNSENYYLRVGEGIKPEPGQVLVARIREIHNHKRIETDCSRKAILFKDALVLLAYGHRYAADQFLAHVPEDLDYCHLVAAGGIAGLVTEQHDKISAPTKIEPLGLLSTDEGIVHLESYAPFHNDMTASVKGNRPEVIAVLGTSMNSGKSTTMACLINGLSKAGLSVGAGKVTGTGAGNDRMIYHDAGATQSIDFTDFGYSTTFRTSFEELRSLTVNMVEVLADSKDVVVIEIADGIYQKETAQLLRDEVFHSVVDQVLFSAVDALGARSGVQVLREAGLHVACASGVMTASPLASAEAREVLREYEVPVVGTYYLTDPHIATALRIRN